MLAPIFAPLRITGPAVDPWRPGESGYCALVSTTFGPIQQPSSSTENSGTNACVWMRTLFAIVDVVLDHRQRADADVVADSLNSRMFTLLPVWKLLPMILPA